MHNQTLILLLGIIALFCSESPAALKKWNQKMQAISSAFSEMLPEIVKSERASPESTKKIERGTKKMLELTHAIGKGGTPPPDADPTLGFVSNLLEREVKHAYRAIKAGHVEYAKGVLRHATGFCISCHTRNDQGPEFPTLELSPKVASLSQVEKAELLAALRRFDQALDEFEKVVGNAKLAKERPIEWGKAVQRAFMISTRVKRDPERTLAIANKVLGLQEIPAFYREYVSTWKQSAEEWKKSGEKKIESESALYKEASRLMEEARQKQAWPLDRSADILYLRASATVHDLLARFPKGEYSGKALLLAGNAYEVLEDRLASPLPEMYYEACIRQSPHSALGEECYLRLEQNVHFGYTGSGGVFIPEDAVKVLEELKTIATQTKK